MECEELIRTIQKIDSSEKISFEGDIRLQYGRFLLLTNQTPCPSLFLPISDAVSCETIALAEDTIPLVLYFLMLV